MNTLPRIGFMLGDVTGIGPEIAAKLLASGKPAACAQTIIIGDRRVLELGMRNANVKFAYSVCKNIDEIQWPRKDYPLIDLGDTDPAKYPQGVSSDEAGKLAGDALKYMIDLAIAGKLDGISFAPLNKGAMNRGGWKFNDEHQMFASLLKHSGFFGEMNVIDQFSTFRVTSHVALREAVKLVPHDQLLVETDSPFLAPMPHRGALNTPAQIANIVRAMAAERNEDVAELATALSDNAERIFGSFA